MSRTNVSIWQRERPGLSAVTASLVVIAVAGVLLANHLVAQHEKQMRERGFGLVRAISALPAEQPTNPGWALRSLSVGDDGADFAYAAITAPDGTSIADMTADGVSVPAWRPRDALISDASERLITAGDHGGPFLEFYAPIGAGSAPVSYVRLGYAAPGLGSLRAELPFYASLCLFVFMLPPLSYFFVRLATTPDRSGAGNPGRAMQSAASVETEEERILHSTRPVAFRENRARHALESLPDAVLSMDESGAITLANRRLESLLGADMATLNGASSFEWCANSDVRHFLNQCRGCTERRDLPAPVEFTIDKASDLTFTIAAHPLFSPVARKSTGCLVIIRDTTLHALARRGRAEFVAHVAHELKTPLNVLSMYSESLQTAEPGDHETRLEAINVIEDEVARLSALISNLLSLTRIEMGSLELDSRAVRIDDLLASALDSVKYVRGADQLDFVCDVPDEVGSINLDEDLLRIALKNLLSNAVKYNRPGGSVKLSVEETNEVLRINVSDTGIGISEVDMPRIFDKFFRSDDKEVRDRSGHGLGLALARDIVDLHNGSLTVTSDPGQGTCFSIALYRETHAIAQAG